MKLSVIIPAYNENENIVSTINEIERHIKDISLIDYYEIVVIDDHSSDNTFDLIEGLNKPEIHCVRLSRRSGSFNAIRAGMDLVESDVILCTAADGQDDPVVIKEMVERWEKGEHVVWGVRKNRKNEELRVKVFAKLFYKILAWFSEPGSSDEVDLARADFYLMDKRVVKAVNSCEERNTSLFGLIAWLGFNQGHVEYDRRERKAGSSKWGFRTRFRFAKDWIIAFSGLPLKLMIFVGFLATLVGVVLAIYILYSVYIDNVVRGWASTLIVVLFMSGIQMIMLGIIGEYLWRSFDETRKRPIYFIEKTTARKLDEST